MNDIRELKRTELGAEYYNDAYKYTYDWHAYINLADQLTKMMKMTGAQDKKIIDIGCGCGWYSDHAYFNISRDMTAIDFSEKGIMHARRQFPCVKFEVANVYDYDYSQFQVAILMETLEHLERDDEVISKLPISCLVYGTVPYLTERDCIAHVRIFDESIIKERYGQYLDIKSIVQVDSFLLFHGVRK